MLPMNVQRKLRRAMSKSLTNHVTPVMMAQNTSGWSR